MGYRVYVVDTLTKSTFGRFSLNSPSDIEIYFNDKNGGLCAGFSMIWIICMLNTYSKKILVDNTSENLKRKYSFRLKNLNNLIKTNPNESWSRKLIETTNIEWFYNTILDIKKEKENDKKYFIEYVKSLFKDVNSATFFLSIGVVSFLEINKLVEKMLKNIIKSEKINNICVLLDTMDHSMALFFQYNAISGYYTLHFYDPNNDSGHQTFSIHNSKFALQYFTTQLKLLLKGEKVGTIHREKIFMFQIFTQKELFSHQTLTLDSEFIRKYHIPLEIKNSHEVIFLLIKACTKNDLLLVKYLMNTKLSSLKLITNIDDYSPLHISVASNFNQITKELLKHGSIDPNGVSKNITPLFLSVLKGNIEIVKILLNHSSIDPNKYCPIDPNLQHGGALLTPLHIAIIANRADIVNELLSHGSIDYSLKMKIQNTTESPTALELAKNMGNENIIKTLEKTVSKKNSNFKNKNRLFN